jgi:hypothetical protein
MAIQLFTTGTEYVANAITLSRGTSAAITGVGVYHNTDPTVKPTVAQFTMVTLVKPGDALADGTNLDVLSLIGPKSGAHLALTPGSYQRWILVQTATEDVIRKVDVIEVI